MPYSTRVNLSVPHKVDAVLAGLAQATGASKASFVMQALFWYLPELRRKLAQFEALAGGAMPEKARSVVSVSPAPKYEVKLSRAERRKAEREAKKLQ